MEIQVSNPIIPQQHEADKLGILGSVAHVLVSYLDDAVLHRYLKWNHQAFHYQLGVLSQQMELVDGEVVPKVADRVLESSLRGGDSGVVGLAVGKLACLVDVAWVVGVETVQRQE